MSEHVNACPACGNQTIAVFHLPTARDDESTSVLCQPTAGGCSLGLSRPTRAAAIATWNFLASASSEISVDVAQDAERYRKWVSYSQFSKESADELLDRLSINEHAAADTLFEQLGALPEGWRLDGTLIYRVSDEPHPENTDEIRVTLAEGTRDERARERLAAQIFTALTEAPAGAVSEEWVNRCLDAAHAWADQSYASGKGKPHQSLADARRALRRLLMEPLAGGAVQPATLPANPAAGGISFRDWYASLSPQWRKVIEAVDPSTAAAASTPADPRVNDLAMLVRRLAYSLGKASPEKNLAEADRAIDYLRRTGLAGFPLRTDDVAVKA